ncbi:MAG: glycosyltransferase [Patescibacteria group bacterium]
MISIIIPTLNEEHYLPLLLEAIKKQKFSDYEIIVSDGGSKDNTQAIARDYGCRFVSDTEHHHPAWQRNNGAAVAQGDVLVFLDADTMLQADFLEKVIAEFYERKLSGAGFYIKFNPNRPAYNIYSFLYNIFCYPRQFFAPASIGAGIVARREAHEAIKGFDTGLFLAEDYDYCYRLSRLGKFRMIKSCRLLYSSRRLLKEGALKVGLKWGLMAVYTLFNFRIKKSIVKYDFGKF